MNQPISKKTMGAVTVGERGQIVIPSEIRKVLKLSPGDKLIVFAKAGHIGMVPAEEFSQFLDRASEIISKLDKKPHIHG